jgi:isocitrate dehydrogenase (NAD+)
MANPTALLLSALMMLDHIGERDLSARIREALGRVLLAGAVRTRDLGGQASTTEFTDAICRAVESGR